MECLAELGWSGSTVGVVAERAGVTRGALQHHFPTREELFLAAVEHVADTRAAELRVTTANTDGEPPSTREVVERVVELHTGDIFRAALALWVASASEPALAERVVELETRIGRQTHRATVELLGVDETAPGVRELIQGTLDMARGLGLANLLTDDRARRDRIVTEWAEVMDRSLHPVGSS